MIVTKAAVYATMDEDEKDQRYEETASSKATTDLRPSLLER